MESDTAALAQHSKGVSNKVSGHASKHGLHNLENSQDPSLWRMPVGVLLVPKQADLQVTRGKIQGMEQSHFLTMSVKTLKNFFGGTRV
jgi:hypothetical protein